MIIEEKPIVYLYKSLKALKIPVYKRTFKEDPNSTPNSYVIIKSENKNIKAFGDGKCLLKNNECEIHLCSSGYAINEQDVHNKNVDLIEEKLKELDLNYNAHHLGFDQSNNQTKSVFVLNIFTYE